MQNSFLQALDLTEHVAGLPHSTVSRLSTLHSKIEFGASVTQETVAVVYDRILAISPDLFPSSIVALSRALNEALSLSQSESVSGGHQGNFSSRVEIVFRETKQK